MFAHPEYLLALPAALLVLLWLVRKDFLPSRAWRSEEESRRSRRRLLIALSRAVVVALLFVALAEPFATTRIFAEGDPEITVLVDESASMGVLDRERGERLVGELRERLPVTVRRMGSEGSSEIGTAALAGLGPDANLLLITDGHVTDGPSLEEIALFATTRNATLNAVRLAPVREDYSVALAGPEKVVAGVQSAFTITIAGTHDDEVPFAITSGDAAVLSGRMRPGTQEFTYAFPEGEHTLTARLSAEDADGRNDAYTLTVGSVEKPKVLLVRARSTGLEQIVTALYDADVSSTLPADLSPYYAVILYDIPASTLSRDTARLATFVVEGNGLVAVGGQGSFDLGGYGSSVLENLLPVRVGQGTPSDAGGNIVIAIDMSGSTLGAVELERTETGTVRRETTSAVRSLQKALAISVVEDLNPSNQVGVLGFTYPQPSSPYGCSGACIIQSVELLGRNKEAVIDKIARVNMSGNTALAVGLEGSMQLLQERSGAKNVIFISDGTSFVEDEERAVRAAQSISSQGGRVFTVQVGDSARGRVVLERIAQAGSGAYFKASQANRLAILFGEPVSIDQGDAFDVAVINQYHFITDDPDVRDMSAVLYGYNQVVPKPGAQLLVASTGGNPILTTWNYGVGRVAALTAFNGPDLGALLSGTNSKLISRTVNWAIGNPERKEGIEVSVPDTTLGRPAQVVVRSDRVPSAEGFSFEPRSGDRYVAQAPADALGVHSVLGTTYAVNYPVEIARVGFNPDLPEQLALAGGEVFTPDEVDRIVAHVRTAQLLQREEREELWWLFVAVALAVFTLEVVVRRISALRRRPNAF